MVIENVPLPFDEDDDRGRTRRNDQATSYAGARAIRYRANTQKAKLLVAYMTPTARLIGLNAEEAARAAHLSLLSCYWKRVSELLHEGLIVGMRDTVGAPITRHGNAGVPRTCYQITADGTTVARQLVIAMHPERLVR